MFKLQKQYRLKNYDYSSDGYYFVTICTKGRKWFFGNVRKEEMKLSKIGEIAKECWQEIPHHFKNVELNEWVIMPNHVHGVIVINDKLSRTVSNCRNEACLVPTTEPTKNNNNHELSIRQKLKLGYSTGNFSEKQLFYSSLSPTPNSLSSIIGSFKSAVAKRCHDAGLSYFSWQSRFYDHVIRFENELHFIRFYIRENPAHWSKDRNNQEGLMM